MPSRPHRAILVAFALLSAAALAASCSKKDSTSPGPSFSFTFPQTGTSHEFTFTDVGSWGYRCIPHGSSGMTGTVIVDPASTNDTVNTGVHVGEGGNFFVPATVTIKPGGRVRWVNLSTATNHTVTRP